MIKSEKELIKTLNCDEICFIRSKKKNIDVEDEIYDKGCEC